jgi:uncharacterized protein (TIGR02145 family)
MKVPALKSLDMKANGLISSLSALLLFCIFWGCKKEIQPVVPVLATSAVSGITLTGASGGGSITSDGGEPITARGVCWSTAEDPTINDDLTNDGSGDGSFSSAITGLKPGTVYYVRAYATNKVGTAYGESVSFTTADTEADIDDNIYRVISIGPQIWMIENLRTTRFNDGSSIPFVPDFQDWSDANGPAYCYYNNDDVNGPVYGALYNWHAVATGKLCPSGWHVPSDQEWTELTDYLGGLAQASAKLKEAGNSHWNPPNEASTNESGFTALPGGYRSWTDGAFFSLGDNCSIWSSTPDDSYNSWSRAMVNYSTPDVIVNSAYNGYGISVRCMMDN